MGLDMILQVVGYVLAAENSDQNPMEIPDLTPTGDS